jgi:hypothetical protein
MRALLYKCFLVALGDAIPPHLASAVAVVERPASKASQTFTPDPSLSPVSQPIPKVGALAQATGEAVYTDDEVRWSVVWKAGDDPTTTTSLNTIYSLHVHAQPLPQHALHGAYVFSTKALAKVTVIDATAALQVGSMPSHALLGSIRHTAASKMKRPRVTTTQMPGVADVVTAKDIEGKNDLSMGAGDEVLLVRIDRLIN